MKEKVALSSVTKPLLHIADTDFTIQMINLIEKA